MLRPGTQDSYISRKVNMPTDLGHGALVSQVSPQIKAQAFFSARVAEARILERLRSVSDQYSRGEIGLGEARNALKDFLKAEGYNPHQAGLKNLASTARLNLILKQNAAMAHSAGEWKRMHDPDAMKVFPYVRYHSRGDSRSRFSHSRLDGKIFHKDDPFLKTHTPPWEFNCRCWLEEITAKEAGRHEEDIQERTPPDQVKVESQSGFSFDPEHAFEKFDLSSIKDAGLRGNIQEAAEIEYGSQISFQKDTAVFEKKDFHTFSDEKLESARFWKDKNLPPPLKKIELDEAKKILNNGKTVSSITGENIVFDNECINHWLEKGKTEEEISSRLVMLNSAIDTVEKPFEVWDQGNQKCFLKVWKKGNKTRCVAVFVNEKMQARTYFLKDLKEFDKVRKGFSVQLFNELEDRTD